MTRIDARPPYPDVLSMIGNTSMVEVTGFDTGPCRLFLKLESQNPGGSIKDRIALSMIEAAEREGRIKPGGTIIEATAGNTGLGLALVAAQKGYRMKLVIPDKMSQDKIFHLKALGAEVVMTRSDVGKGHPDYYQDMAERLEREIPNSFWVNQFANPANPAAHEKTTGPEIWEQMGHDLDAVVCGVGSGGTISGLGRYFKRVAPDVRMVLADPEGSVVGKAALTGEVPSEVGSWLVEGIGEDFIPPNCDLSLIADAVYVSDREGFHAARDLVARTGVLGGSSTGTLLAGALKWCRRQTEPKRVVTFVCDTGNKYLSKVYNDAWMVDNGLMELESHGDLRDLVVRRADRGQLVTAKTTETLGTAYGRMRMFDVSQIPVMDDKGRLVGLVDESDVMLAAQEGTDPFGQSVADHMVENLEIVHPGDSPDSLLPLFRSDKVAIVMEDDHLFGLITKVDFINHLRRRGR
ncbi:pyridoxal-phosphate dependent enzyme [Marivibrio halodurans]|uniref:Cysteine synthase B n=1 Tax=Marivibrio halodurans TaxID=2039722 RepID=A0A8J7SHH8_9PROT|nr:pyridoxal-phosphate dependent enzyme [Marivibrio halodurans]MBP5856418.1 pyridoxal-phosphate dependent enzyme [Marivibrio halodurans]